MELCFLTHRLRRHDFSNLPAEPLHAGAGKTVDMPGLAIAARRRPASDFQDFAQILLADRLARESAGRNAILDRFGDIHGDTSVPSFSPVGVFARSAWKS